MMTNTFGASNRPVSSNSSIAAVQPIYNVIGNQVRQVVSDTTTFYTLDVEGLLEVITSTGEIYVHFFGVIETEKTGQYTTCWAMA
jgi:phage gp37-like protein